MNIKKNLYFPSDFGQVAYDIYEPERIGSAPIIIQIAHGGFEHKNRYEWAAQALSSQGYIVAINDHRGHGDSINNEQGITLGSMGDDGFSRASYDLYKLSCLLKEEYKNARIVLLGHSLGSLLARRYLSLYNDTLSALILSGSPSPTPRLRYGIAYAKMLRFFGAKTFGQKYLTRAIFRSFYKCFTQRIKHDSRAWKQLKAQESIAMRQASKHIARTLPFLRWLCSSTDVAIAYLEDEKCRFYLDIESYLHVFIGMQDVYGTYPSPKNTTLPILFISGSDDASGDFGRGVKAARKHLEQQGFSDVNMLLYSNARHDLLHEPIKEQILADIHIWLQSKHITLAHTS